MGWDWADTGRTQSARGVEGVASGSRSAVTERRFSTPRRDRAAS